MSTLLVDGSNLFMIHWSSNTATDFNAVPVGAFKGSLNFISKFCQAYQPTKCIIFFDGKNGSAKRKSIFKNYKGGRKPRTVIARNIGFQTIDAAQRNQDYQFKALLEVLETLPVNVIISNDYEADDGIAYIVKYKQRYGIEKDDSIVIVSCDKDFGQLIDENVSIYNPITKSFITKDNFLEKYEVSHQNYLFYRTITGDKSDCLPGIKGIGPATLKKVLDITSSEKLTIDSIKALNDDNKTAKKLKENLELIELNEKLMSLSEPLISLSVAERLDYQLMNFEPRLNKIQFMIKSGALTNLDPSMTTNFNSLLTRK